MRKVWLLAALISISYITLASTLTEFDFASKGYKDFYIISLDGNGCTDYSFQLPDINGEMYAVLGVHAAIKAAPRSVAGIDFYLNNGKEKLLELSFPEFSEGIEKTEVPVQKLAADNKLRICGTISGSGGSVTVFSDSSLGIYSGAHFPEKGGVVLTPETYSPIAGVPFRITATARNFGTEDAEARLMYRKEELKDRIPELDILLGETSNDGIVPKCAERDAEGFCTRPGEYSIEYMAVANKAVPMTLLPAVLEYTDGQGARAKQLSNRPNIGAIEAPQKISVHMIFDKGKLYAGREMPLAIRVQNLVKGEVKDITVKPETGLEITGEQAKAIGSLPEGQSVDLMFTAKGASAGNYVAGCTADYEGRKAECETTVVKLEQGLNAELIGSAALTIIGLLVLAYFYYKK